MSDDIKLSVLVTFCNQKEFIKDALDSIFNQITEYKYEVIVCIDGKCEGSEEIIMEYMSRYDNIALYKTSSPKDLIPLSRASYNRSLLASKALGEYVVFLDGDDFYIDKNKFQKAINFLDNNYEYMGFAHSHRLYDHKNNRFTSVISTYSKPTRISKSKLLNDNMYLFSNDIIFRNIFKYTNVKYINDLYLNDTTLTLWILKYGDIYFVPVPMLGYRVNINSIYSGKIPIEKRINELILNEEHCKLYKNEKKYFKRKVEKIIKDIFVLNEKCNFDIYTNQINKRNLFITKNIIKYIYSYGIVRYLYKVKILILSYII